MRAPTATVQGAASYSHTHRARFLAELKNFVRLASISGQPQHAGEVRACAEWLADHLRQVGLAHVQVIPTPRHPIVFADWRHAPGQPTVLIYGHYDVQPVDPVSAWRTPPFEPTVRGQDLFGRGAADDKGQLFAHVKAVEAFLRTQGRLPVNVICLFEGEEEIGSPSLAAFLTQHRDALVADVALVSDTRMLGPDRPAITHALRGGLALELEVQGPQGDLHSGNFGGAVHNPLQALCDIIAQLHDAQGRIAIPHFYDRVRRWPHTERAYMAQHGPGEAEILRDARVAQGWGEPGFSVYERTTIRPALTINGLTGGYQGPGGKAIIPARAQAKLSFRLVPDQDPDEIEQLVRARITRLTPPTVQTTVRIGLKAQPALVDRFHPALRAAMDAYWRGFGVPPVFLRSGGSIPVVNLFETQLGVPTVLMGFALPDDRLHAPNEKFHLPNFYRGIETSLWFLARLPGIIRHSETHRPAFRRERIR